MSKQEQVVILEDPDEEDTKIEPTPLPILPLFVLCCVVLSEAFSITMIFPFLAQMVLDFNLTDDESEVGFYAGWIASSFNLAQFTSSFAWGKLSDRIGRRPVILIGLSGNLLMMFLFGWSKELWFAILARSLNGFLNGNVSVVKTYLGEITDKTNAAKGFGVFGVCWSTGFIIGPSVGGFLSSPSTKAPHIFPPGSLFDKFPYLLPCLVSCFITFMGLVVGFFFLKETVKHKKDSPAEESPLISNQKGLAVEEDLPNETCMSFFKAKEVVITSALFAFLGFYKMMLDEVFALWAPQSQSIGGINFQSTEIGILYASSGAAGLISQFFLFPRLISSLGPLLLFRISSAIMAILICCLPLSNLIVNLSTTGLWVYLCTIFVLHSFCGNFLFVSVMILINNSSSISSMGAVNGFAQTWTSLLRSISPTIGSYVLAWSLNNGLSAPLNFYFTFLFIGFFSMLNFILTFMLNRDSIDNRKPPEYRLPS